MKTPAEDRPVWLDGRRVTSREATLPLADEATLAGAGLFETIALRGGRPVDLDAHLARLARGAAMLGATLPDPSHLSQQLLQAAQEESAEFGWLKLVLTRGGHCAIFTGRSDPAEQGRAISAVLLPWRRNARDPLVRLKSLNYAANLLGMEQARRRGADEGIWLNTRGHLAEGCRSNLFVVQGRRLFTPGENQGILPGVVRALALRAARGAGLVVHEGKLRLKRLLGADEAFLTSSLGGVRPLVRFEGRVVGKGKPGAITLAIAAGVASIRSGG
jgi:branched-subunit amino acid aminotransferase/4-amino-4-deoxychorismate lyase